MTIVESDVELFTIHQAQGESLDEYYKVFKAQVDTIDAHGGNAGYHSVVFTLYLAALLQKKELAEEDYDAMGEDSKKAIQSDRSLRRPRRPIWPACSSSWQTTNDTGALRRRWGTITCWASKSTPRTC